MKVAPQTKQIETTITFEGAWPRGWALFMFNRIGLATAPRADEIAPAVTRAQTLPSIPYCMGVQQIEVCITILRWESDQQFGTTEQHSRTNRKHVRFFCIELENVKRYSVDTE